MVDGTVAQNWEPALTGCCGEDLRVDLRGWGYFCRVLCEIVRRNVIRGIGTLGPRGNGGGAGGSLREPRQLVVSRVYFFTLCLPVLFSGPCGVRDYCVAGVGGRVSFAISAINAVIIVHFGC